MDSVEVSWINVYLEVMEMPLIVLRIISGIVYDCMDEVQIIVLCLRNDVQR